MTTHRNAALDPRHFVIIKPLPILKPSGEMRQARSRTVWSACQPTREQVFWDNYHRRQWQLSRQGYRAAPWRPYEEVGQPLYLETKRLILESLGQPVEEASKADPLPEEDVPVCTTPSDSPGANKSLPFRCPQAGKREDAVSLRKHLGHTSRLVSAVRQGRGYFHLLQKKEKEQEEAQQREQKRKEEWQRVQPRPPCSESDSDSDPGRKKAQSARPFTPIHCSLTSPQASEPPQGPIFRQLCCLNWLLEALTLDRTGRAGPVTSCWDLKDPGQGKTTLKTLNKERAIETKWDQFVSLQKPRRTGSRPSRSSSGRLYLLKGSSLSVASSSALTTPTLLGSLSSLGPGIEDTGATLTGAIVTATGASQDSAEQPGAGGDSETELPMSEYLQKLLDEVHQSVTKDFGDPEQIHGDGTLTVGYRPPTQPTPQREDNTTRPKTKDTPRPKSCPAKPLSATSELISSKRSMLWDMRTAYEERAEELAQIFSDSLDHNARKRLESGIQRFQALCHVTHSHLIPRHVTPRVTGMKPPETDCSNNNMWLSSLLSNLPPEVSQDRGVSRVLEKLSRFADERTPKVRPHVFLKMLGGLQPWELCLPDLCVAIEIAREHVVQMSREDYDSWLLSRVTLPQQQDH
ncbi:coiled-coil domain-containing protein 60 isoform X2 [Oncorhynchus mykiss]|uniref:coiled-coil domain-containing protein 60 isoform X2 n=1 Tax=Oncorhynchus mykiss TaxID=8022 RepID=UPI001877B735|nr:coiled-coil domain-containing protein 60 isoform X2 [Oncorhynchus mykiss]